MNSGESVFTIGKVLSGLSRSLGIAREVIPLYEQTKPLFKNAKKAYNILKDKTPIKIERKPIKKLDIPELQEKKTINNSPQFFI